MSKEREGSEGVRGEGMSEGGEEGREGRGVSEGGGSE